MSVQQPQMVQQMALQMMPQMTTHQPNLQAMMPEDHSLQMCQYPSMELPQMAMSQVQLPSLASTPTASFASGESTPTCEIDRCMGIIIPQAAQFPCDRDSLAAQLKAAADCCQ